MTPQERHEVENTILFHLGPSHPEAEVFALWQWSNLGKDVALDWIKRYSALRMRPGRFAPQPEPPTAEHFQEEMRQFEQRRKISASAYREMEAFYGIEYVDYVQ